MKLRPRLSRATIATALVGVVGTITALLVAGPATATGTGGGGTSADQALAWFYAENSTPTDSFTSTQGRQVGILYQGVSSELDLTFTASTPDGFNTQLPIDILQYQLPAADYTIDSVTPTATATNGETWSVALTQAGGYYVVTATDDNQSGNAGLMSPPGDSVTIKAKVTALTTKSFKFDSSTMYVGIHDDLTNAQGHADYDPSYPYPGFQVGLQKDCPKNKPCPTTTLGAFQIDGAKSTTTGTLSAFLAKADVCSPTAGTASTLAFDVTGSRSKTVTMTGLASADVCFKVYSDAQAFYDSSLTTLVQQGTLPTCDALGTFLKDNHLGKTSDYPCTTVTDTSSGGVTSYTVVVTAPAGDPRLTIGL